MTDTANDLINVSGDLTLDDGWTVKVITSESATVGDEWTLMTYGDTLSLGATTIDISEAAGWGSLALSVEDAGGSVVLKVVPEPGTIVLLLSGLVGLVVLWRRRRS